MRSMWKRGATRGRTYDDKSITDVDTFPELRDQINSFFATGAKLKAAHALAYDFNKAEDICFEDVASLLRSHKDPTYTAAVAGKIRLDLLTKIDATAKSLVRKKAFEKQAQLREKVAEDNQLRDKLAVDDKQPEK